MSDDVLRQLAETIRARRAGDAEASYTRKLLDAGPAKIGKKLGEEAVETIIAAVAESDEALAGEAADLIYHLLVLLEARSIDVGTVLEILERRMGRSGLEEKASRGRSG
ncbi:MAG: phosphoribosyl-ATP diphosphatase [Hyphomicrobiaceae bacterium]|nr:phosphoribosyl-ATP diphosphatase [Hyphomicrobiaceae bacterium]